MTPQRDDKFDEWYASTFGVEVADPPSQRAVEWKKWASRVFDTNGPLDRQALAVVHEFEQIDIVDKAVENLRADLSLVAFVVGSRVPFIAIDAYDNGLRFTVDGGSSEGSIVVEPPFDISAVTVEIVRHVRSEVSQDDSVSLPACSLHDYVSLDAVIDRGRAVWRCGRGEHIVAAVGALTDPS